MKFQIHNTQQSDFPKRSPGKPCIFAERVGPYPCFCVSDLYLELFAPGIAGDGSDVPLISFPEKPHMLKRNRELLAFLLPQQIFRQIETEIRDGHAYVRDYDYREFFLVSTNNNKITRLLFSLFSTPERNSERRFLQSVQAHFVEMLRPAVFREPQLKETLCDLADRFLVPASISPGANRAFHLLLDSGSHDAVARAIANMFVSAMLGLYSMKYLAGSEKSPGFERKRNYLHLRTYLLNTLGMEFIWTPETISSSYVKLQDARYDYECGRFEFACRKAVTWLAECGSYAKNGELASAYQVLGACLCLHPEQCDPETMPDAVRSVFHAVLLPFQEASEVPDGTGRKSRLFREGLACLERCVSLDNTQAEAYYLLYDCCKNQEDEHRVCSWLCRAFSLNNVKAVMAAADRYVKGRDPLPDISEETILRKLSVILSNPQVCAGVDVSECLYLRGRLRSGHRNSEVLAQDDFAQAAAMGHERARQELSRKERMERQRFPAFSEDPAAPFCFVNSLSGNNLSFVSTLPDGEWALCTTDRQAAASVRAEPVRDLDELIQKASPEGPSCQRPRMVFLFMSPEEDRNLNECLMLLDRLFNLALRACDSRRLELMDRIDIFVGAKYEMASMLLDASINDMGSDIYFKVHIADETRDAVHRLLSDAPLFIPFLQEPRRESSAEIVLFGCSELNYRFVKESIACAYLGPRYPVRITMLGDGAARMERRLHQECPGLFHGPHISCIRPRFIPCSIAEADFPSLIYGAESAAHPDDELVKTLRTGNYFVVDLATDRDSIRFAMELRTWLLRSRGTFDRTPFIAVKCTDEQNSYLASHLTLAGQAAGNQYYSRYDLFPFGIPRALYSFRRLIENPRLEEVALRIHKSYYGGNNRQAENDYYSFSYNADSSLLTAIALSYRLFAGGAFFAQKEQYLDDGALNSLRLLSDYVEAVRPDPEAAAALEQARWNGFMLSRGWESADAAQVRAYRDQSTGSSHKHMLAKLHPFIREWDALDSDDLMQIMGMLQSKFDYNKLPQATTRKSIQDTPVFLVRSGSENDRSAFEK